MKFFRWGRSFSDEDYSFEVWVAFGRVIFSIARDNYTSCIMHYSINIEVIQKHARPELRA